MVKPDLVRGKVARAKGWLDQAEKLISAPLPELMKDEDRRDLAGFRLFLAIQECIDLAAHWIADMRWGSPDDAASMFDVLADRQAIDRDLAQQLRGAVGLRNRIAHGYSTVDHALVQKQFQEGAATLRRFLGIVSTEAGL